MLKVGEIINTHGLKGELKVYPYTDFPEKRFAINSKVYLLIDNNYQEFFINGFRLYKNLIYISLQGLNSINLVEKYKSLDIYVDENEFDDIDEDYYFKLYNLEVFDQANKYLGRVESIYDNGRQSILKVVQANNYFYLPFVDEFIVEIDYNKKKIIVKLIDGLINEN